MLPPFIIEQIRQREEKEQARREDQPRLELPLEGGKVPDRRSHEDRPQEEEDDKDRGVVVVDLG